MACDVGDEVTLSKSLRRLIFDDSLRAQLHELTLDDLVRHAEGAGLRRPLAEPISFSI